MTGLAAFDWSARAIGLAVLLQTAELLRVRRVCADQGVWSWPVLALEHRTLLAPLRWLLAGLLPYRCFVSMLWLRALLAALVLSTAARWPLPWLWLSQVAICVRFRGTFNGGSDYMTVLILGALSFAAIGGEERWFASAGLLYIAVQVTFSYLIAGLGKLRNPDWRSGRALRTFVLDSPHGAPPWSRALLSRDAPARALSWIVIGFECSYPLAWLDSRLCVAWLVAGFAFHLGNARVFGLNRFVFAWAAGYPALLYCSQLFGVVSQH
jgi:hypothetical protein